MKDFLHPVLKFIDHYRWTFLSLAILVVIIVGSVGCQPRTKSPLTGKSVTTKELTEEVKVREVELEKKLAVIDIEMASLSDRTTPAFQELEDKRAFIGAMVVQANNLITQWAGPASVPLSSLLASVGLLMGAGATADNRRKDKKIKESK